VHTLLAIREVDLGSGTDPGHVPGVAVLAAFVLALTSIAVLVMYVHHVGQALRISALVELAGKETRRLLDRVYPDHGEVSVEDRDSHIVTATKSGVVTCVAHDRLVEAARSAGCVLELLPSLGDYVPAGATLFTVHGESERVDSEAVRSGVILSMERTLDQDVAYGLRLLVDMTERSLSESRWQDPTTAVQAIDRLHDCLRQLVRRPIPDGRFHDEAGQLRLIQHVMTWEAYVHLAFGEIRLAGAASPQVARRLQSALRDLLAIAPEDRRGVLKQELDLLRADSAEALAHPEDVARAQQPDAGGINTSGDRSQTVH
jgi:uncharacterized membrane protein